MGFIWKKFISSGWGCTRYDLVDEPDPDARGWICSDLDSVSAAGNRSIWSSLVYVRWRLVAAHYGTPRSRPHVADAANKTCWLLAISWHLECAWSYNTRKEAWELVKTIINIRRIHLGLPPNTVQKSCGRLTMSMSGDFNRLFYFHDICSARRVIIRNGSCSSTRRGRWDASPGSTRCLRTGEKIEAWFVAAIAAHVSARNLPPSTEETRPDAIVEALGVIWSGSAYCRSGIGWRRSMASIRSHSIVILIWTLRARSILPDKALMKWFAKPCKTYKEAAAARHNAQFLSRVCTALMPESSGELRRIDLHI